MNPDAAEIFHQAREMPAEKREGFLLGACGGDVALRGKVEALLQADAEAGRFLSAPTAVVSAQPDAAFRRERPGTQIDRYKLLEEIGEGGMGTVWMAEQREPVKRRVALKIIKLGMDTRQVIARFEAERQALAMMDHPHIAKVFDAGATDSGRPYFVMEYIRGVPILEYCDNEKVDTRARLQLFISVCQAIQHAHQKGIIHRDIKPANVLVTLHDGAPVPKVIDFGIAKATNSELTQKTLFTQHRQVIGTPAYMSPEQAEMSGLDIDTRSDIYSLGVLLYELLTGTTPFDTQELLSLGFGEMMRVIREREPQKPSTRVSTLGDTGARTAQQRRVDQRRLGALLRGDLDWIVMRCLEKDRTRRYETANGLAADIARHLRDEPVTARAPSASYRLRKFLRRNRAQVVAASLIMIAVLAGTLGAAWGLVQESRSRSADLQRQLEDEQREAAEEARLGRNAEAVAALLAQAGEALQGGDAAKAKLALDAARKRSAEGGADPQAERLERLLADQVLLGELDAVDQLRWSWEAERFAEWTDVAARTREALERFGCDPDTVPLETAAARIRASLIGERILAALDRRLLRERTASVRDLLRRVDPDPYRSAVREAIQVGEWRTLVALAEQDEALDQPPFFSAFLGENGTIPAARRRELLHAAVTRRSSDASLLMALGTLSNSMDDPVERIRWFQAAVAADPDNVAALNDLGMGLFQRGARAESIAYVERAVALDPQMATALCNLGSRHLEDGRLDEALECFERVVEARPEYAHGHFLLGNGRAAEGDLDEAVACYRRALVLDRDMRPAHLNLSTVLAELGRLDEAIASGRRAADAFPEDADARMVLSRVLRAQGRVDEALDPARKAVELDPGNVRAQLSLGVLLCDDLRDFDGALACFERAHELAPELPEPIVNMGCALTGKGELEAALARFRQALEVDPRHCWARVSMAVALGESAAESSDPEERARLWRQTLAALREALTLYTERAQRGGPAELAAVKADLEMMRHPDVEVLRDPGSWAVLPAEERGAFARLWVDLDAFSERIGVRASGPAGGDGPAPDEPSTDGPGADDSAATRSFLRQSLDRREAELGPDHRSALELRLHLATECISAGDCEQAVPLLEEALERARARFGVEDHLTIGCMVQLGTACYRTGRLDRSIPLFEEALPLQVAMFGSEHPMTLMLAANLGVNYRKAGRLEEAIPLLEEARRAVVDDGVRSWVTQELFEACSRLDPASACEHLDPLIPELQADFGEDHILTLVGMNNLGFYLARARRFDEAEAVLEDTIEREVRALGEGHSLLLQTRTNLGELYLLRKQHARAEELLQRCLAERSTADPDSFQLAMTRSLLGRALAEQQEFSEAEPLLLAACQWLRAHPAGIPAWGSYVLPDTLGWLVELYQDWGRPADAETWQAARAANAAPGSETHERSGR